MSTDQLAHSSMRRGRFEFLAGVGSVGLHFVYSCFEMIVKVSVVNSPFSLLSIWVVCWAGGFWCIVAGTGRLVQG